MLELFEQTGRQRVYINLQPNGEGHFWANSGTHSSQSGSLDRLVQFERIAPKRLIAERIKTEDPAP